MGLVYKCRQVQPFVIYWVDPVTGYLLQPEVFIVPIPEVRERNNFFVTLVSQLYLYVVQLEVMVTGDGYITYTVPIGTAA